MGRPYNPDLRERVIDAVGATSRLQTAACFGAGAVTAIRWMAACTTTETMAACPQGRTRRSKLDPHEALLWGLIDGKVDITLEEMRAPMDRARSRGRGGHALELPRRAQLNIQKPGPAPSATWIVAVAEHRSVRPRRCS